MPLAGPGKPQYVKASRALEPGDTVLLMSDGFPELFSASGEMLGYEQVVDVFKETAAAPPASILEYLREKGTAWSGSRPQDDDVTFVVMRVKEAPM